MRYPFRICAVTTAAYMLIGAWVDLTTWLVTPWPLLVRAVFTPATFPLDPIRPASQLAAHEAGATEQCMIRVGFVRSSLHRLGLPAIGWCSPSSQAQQRSTPAGLRICDV